MAESQDRKVSLTGSNLFCHYTHGVADTSLVSLDACPDSHYPVRPGATETRLIGIRWKLAVGRRHLTINRLTPQSNSNREQSVKKVKGYSASRTTADVVLVHGAWADGSSWAHVVTPLQSRG